MKTTYTPLMASVQQCMDEFDFIFIRGVFDFFFLPDLFVSRIQAVVHFVPATFSFSSHT